MSIDVMKQALEALEALEELADEVFSPYDNKLGNAILALRAAIEQEPVAWMYRGNLLRYDPDPNAQDPVIPLYAGDLL